MRTAHGRAGGLALAAALLTAPAALAQGAPGVSLNYDTLSSLEEPLAQEVGDVTIALTGLVDARGVDDWETSAPFEPAVIANAQISAETQLPNRWTVTAAYFGQYESDPGSILDIGGDPGGGHYTDNLAGFVGGAWGIVAAGDVTGMVREETRRDRGAGNAALVFDNVYGGLRDLGAGYRVRLGPAQILGVVDEDGAFDLGASWSRPMGNKDYRFTARYTDGEFLSADRAARFDTAGVSGVAELVFASGTYDIGGGYETLDGPGGLEAERVWVSAGSRWKTGALTLSFEGHYGRVEGEDETAAAIGAAWDIARGLSVNLGINHARARAMVGAVTLVDKDATEAAASLRYSF